MFTECTQRAAVVINIENAGRVSSLARSLARARARNAQRKQYLQSAE
jgi:hypothetical protein